MEEKHENPDGVVPFPDVKISDGNEVVNQPMRTLAMNLNSLPNDPGTSSQNGEMEMISNSDAECFHSEDISTAFEDVFEAAHLRGASEFTVQYPISPCRPGLSIVLVRGDGENADSETQFEALSENQCYYCYSCCVPTVQQWQTINVNCSNMNVLSFSYIPEKSCFAGKKDRMVYVYIPQRQEPIGWVKYQTTILDGINVEIKDSLSNSTFTATPTTGSFTNREISITVKDKNGMPVAIGMSWDWVTIQHTNTCIRFKIQYSPQSANLSASSKVTTLVACLVWILAYRENALGKRCGCLVGVLLGIAIAMFVVWLCVTNFS